MNWGYSLTSHHHTRGMFGRLRQSKLDRELSYFAEIILFLLFRLKRFVSGVMLSWDHCVWRTLKQSTILTKL